MPNLRHLRAVMLVARHQSVKMAASELHLSRPGISQAIRNIEASVTQRLFHRLPRGMRLTLAGQMFCPRVERAIVLIEEACVDICSDRKWAQSSPIIRRINTAQLRALTAVGEARTFSLAARLLGVSPPAVHRAARDLEAALETSLFEKTSSCIALTEPGLVLANASKRAFAEIRAGFDEARSLHDNQRQAS